MKTREITLTALLIAVLAICAQISIPFGAVPLTFQTLGFLLIGYLLPAKLAALATIGYTALGLIGLPVFAGGASGLGSIASPSFGYILSSIFATVAMAIYLQKTSRSLMNLIIAALIATAIIYLIGVSYLAYILIGVKGKALGFMAILNIGMLPFLVGDAIKAALAIIIAKRVQPMLHKFTN